ncbi:hypothetical protein A6024_18600 [Rhodovulum sulfidophilum]|nr:hypothetical protein A6024_18600 [Rhodovulum sulfidophilum]
MVKTGGRASGARASYGTIMASPPVPGQGEVAQDPPGGGMAGFGHPAGSAVGARHVDIVMAEPTQKLPEADR